MRRKRKRKRKNETEKKERTGVERGHETDAASFALAHGREREALDLDAYVCLQRYLAPFPARERTHSMSERTHSISERTHSP